MMESDTASGESGPTPVRGLNLLLEAGWYGAGFAAVLALALVNLYYPFGSDQAAFFYGAQELDQGATLYVDYWDNKQPGLYLFYLVAGQLFGFSEYGIHLLELIWMMVFALVLMITLRPHLKAPWLSALAPLATIGVYYAGVTEYELTQLEMIVAFPLYLTAWCCLHAVTLAETRSSPWGIVLLFFLSGCFAALAVFFKLLLAVIPITFWLLASFFLFRGRALTLVGLATRFWIPGAVGVALPLAATLFWFWQAGALQELLWTSFAYPSEAFSTSPPAPKSRLLTATAFFLSSMAPWLLFTAIAAGVWLGRRSGDLQAMMLAWLVVGAVLFLIQRFSWWEYHMLLLFVPAGILALCGVDWIAARLGGLIDFGVTGRLSWLRHTEVPAMLCTLLFAAPLAASLAGPFLAKTQKLFYGAEVLRQGLQAYHWRASENYERLWVGSRFLTEPDARPGPIYAFGSALVYPFTGRTSSHITAGAAWEYYLPAQTREILEGFDAQQVPYVFVDRSDEKLFQLRPEVARYLLENYTRLKKDDSGSWYERK
ncbi:glycosyltransferase family 39 protein [Denitrobaculum tricleocarpae]|uniref:Glycosyltransferase family 39 protein n=1 Tax=Denitrobaculum tricleocarpae TaxID=2591009 RepID=A0A545TKE5_9PROT|nr:glycosyltransferase family 39 protein [Denitrobaculum tricleocarpae]TQV77677.1 glycosyltransferase family 39 protein [Denitrobaculum tricleocarpae]